MRGIKLAVVGIVALAIALVTQVTPAQAAGTYTGAEEICTTGGVADRVEELFSETATII